MFDELSLIYIIEICLWQQCSKKD